MTVEIPMAIIWFNYSVFSWFYHNLNLYAYISLWRLLDRTDSFPADCFSSGFIQQYKE